MSPHKEQTAERVLRALTLEEKCSLLSGKNMWETLDLESHGILSIKTTDGPAGVRGAKWTDGSHTTHIPCGISLAATFDPHMVERIGALLGSEAKSKDAHVLLAPTMNISRSPLGGRNFENFGEDPYLTGIMATSYISGVQSEGVGACMKHYVANDMETRRFNMNETIDERTLREIYLKPFHMALAASPWTAMTAYPKINGEHADTSSLLVNDILRKEWGFDGLVMSDWGGLNETVKSILATTDLEMPGPPLRYGENLLHAVRAGLVSEQEHINPSVRRLLELAERLGRIQAPDRQYGSAAYLIPPKNGQHKDDDSQIVHVHKDEGQADTPEFRQLTRDAASGGIVLLKNTDSLLPLQPSTVSSIAIIGPNAAEPTTGGTGSAIVNPYYTTTPKESIESIAKELNPSIRVGHERGIYTYLQPPLAGDAISLPDKSAKGVRCDFYHGYDYAGEIVATSYWQDSMVYLMSDGDTPRDLKGKPFSYKVHGLINVPVSGKYDFSFSSTGKAKLFVNDELVIDNSDWTKISGNFMNCGSEERFASLWLDASVDYRCRVDNVAVPPPTRPHDNTLFHRISGVRVGLLLKHDEERLFASAVEAAKKADVAVIVVGHNNDTEREGSDRTSIHLPGQSDALVKAVCHANPRTVVVTQSACAIAMPWIQKASAVVHAWYQGQENGNALADVLFGKQNPSGKLPLTFPRRLEDHGSHEWFPGDAANDQATYGEEVLVGYRWMDAKNIEPLFPFGYGLSYTSFKVSSAQPDVAVQLGDRRSVKVSVAVQNTGSVDGSEVVQAYVSASSHIAAQGLPAAERSLASFRKVKVTAGATEVVDLEIQRDAFAWYDVTASDSAAGGWRVDSGRYYCFVGTNSRDTAFKVTIDVL